MIKNICILTDMVILCQKVKEPSNRGSFIFLQDIV